MNKTIGLIIAVLIAFGVTEVRADETELLIVEVDADLGSFDTPAGIPGPFNVEGTIVGGGTFQCWGWFFADGSTNVSQVYNIDGRGAIMTQGQEGFPLAVVGGTGDFSNVRGEGEQDLINFPFFTIEFNLTGADEDEDDEDEDDD